MVLFPTYIHIVRTMAKSQKRSDKNEVKSFVGMALACLHALYFYPMYLLVFFLFFFFFLSVVRFSLSISPYNSQSANTHIHSERREKEQSVEEK